ncbi:glycosyltransferase family 4 protein [Candidatus Pelagibacter sp. Uisw_099_02]|uniref:glycosyltransferase family 4 protein n=1 Tax=Candidatus Pelagibacter sp. Uisw_099_02 TaxID=3230981 RepID=UPI0039ED7B24|tara:strand:- start:200 stop:1198 length:999 start_codon:yes stop_codon:yes gene_type:complete
MIKIASNFNPLRIFSKSGPNVFISRLFRSFNTNSLFNVKSGIFPNYDLGLYLVKKGKLNFKKPYFLRNGGIYIDKVDTIKNSKFINSEIFKSAEYSKGIIFNAEFCRKLFFSFYKLKNKIPTTVIYNGVPLSLFNPDGLNFRNRIGFSQKDKVIIVSASWRRHKRLEETIKLLEKLNDDNNENFRLIVLGKVDKTLRIKKNIYFAGEVIPSSLPNWYRSADIYLHLSWIEPNANTLAEAIGSGLPCICTNNGGVGETVKMCNAGIVSNADDDYQFNSVDYYNPPEPNYTELKKDILTLFDNLKYFKNNIDRNPINIDNIAVQYSDFINKNYK